MGWLEQRFSAVVGSMTNQDASDVSYCTTAEMESYFQTGYDWWAGLSSDSAWKSNAYYTGASRASFYGGTDATIAAQQIGIFQPSSIWAAATKCAAGTGYVASTSQAKMKTASYSVLAKALPTEEAPLTYGGVQWYWDKDTNTVHVDPAENPESGYEVGVMPNTATITSGWINKESEWAMADPDDQYPLRGYAKNWVFGEGVVNIPQYTIQFIDPYEDLWPGTHSIQLPSTLKQIDAKAFYGSPGDGKTTATMSIAGVYDDHYTESQLSVIDADAFGFFTKKFTKSSLDLVIPDAVTTETFSNPLPKVTKVPYKGYEVAKPEVTTSFLFDGTEKKLDIAENDAYTVEGTVSATESGAYAARISLNKYYTWPDGSTDDIYIGWAIAPKSYSQDDLDKAKADAEKAAKASQFAQGLNIDTSNKVVKCKKGKKKLVKAVKTKKVKVTGAKGKVSYAKVAKGSSKKLGIAKGGKITVKKGTKKGSYKIKVKVTAAAQGDYKATSATVTITVVVK